MYSWLFLEFPSLSKTILDAGLPSITLKMTKGDMEPYVRATAYKCLQEMIEMNEIWENLLMNDKDIIVSMPCLRFFL